MLLNITVHKIKCSNCCSSMRIRTQVIATHYEHGLKGVEENIHRLE